MVKKCGPVCPDEPLKPKVEMPPITPIVSVKSVNGEVGDVVLKNLIVGEKIYNGGDQKRIVASDLGLGKAFVYIKQVNTKTEAEALMTDAKCGDIVFCKENKYYYLSVGEGEHKTIASEAGTIPPEVLATLATKEELVASLLTKADKEDVEEGLAAKQDKLTAGENISIVNNVISSTSASKLTQVITAGQSVGGITAGTTFPVGTSLEVIIRQLLSGEPPVTGVKLYHGLVNELPTTDAEIEELTLDQSKDKATLVGSGYTWKNVKPVNQYFIMAIPNNLGLSCYDIKTNGYSAACVELEVGNYLVYHVGVKSTEPDGYRVVYSFEEA